MRSQTPPSPIPPVANPSRFRILESRGQYRSCHIQVPDESDRLAAIQVGDHYYSFFKVIKEWQKALQVVARLVYKGDEVVMTQTSKGAVIWILEPEACISQSKEPANRFWQMLQNDWEYESCTILVPDVAQPLEAIFTKGKYYSLWRVVKDQETAIELADRLTQKGNETVMTLSDRGFSIWVLEPDAYVQLLENCP